MKKQTIDVTVSARITKSSERLLRCLAAAFAGQSTVVVCATEQDGEAAFAFLLRTAYKIQWPGSSIADRRNGEYLEFDTGGNITIYVPKVAPEPDLPRVFIDDLDAWSPDDERTLEGWLDLVEPESADPSP